MNYTDTYNEPNFKNVQLIAINKENPPLKYVLDRVIVSEDWECRRLENDLFDFKGHLSFISAN